MNPNSLEAMYALLTAYDNSHEPRPLFNNRENAFAVILSFLVFSWLCVALRLYTRFALRCLGIDDLLMLIFRITATIGSVSVCLSFSNGFGEHILNIGVDNIVTFQKAGSPRLSAVKLVPCSRILTVSQKFYVSLVSFTISTTLMKLTLLSQYLRIFDRSTKTRKFVWVMIIISVLWGAAFSFCAIAPCFPVTGFWDWTAPAVCYGFGSKAPSEIAGTFIAHGVSNATLDLIVLSIPVPICMSYLISPDFKKSSDAKQRVAIGVLFCLGLTINVINIWRVQTVVLHQAGTYPVLDPTWYGPISIVLGVIEVDLASICASIPVFWPIISQSINKIFVTQEVHVTHQHRRLSGDDEEHYELHQAATSPSQHSRIGSEASLKLVLTGTMASSQARDHYQDSYVKNSVLPLGMLDKEATSEAQVMSEGARGFERDCKKECAKFGISSVRASNDTERDQDGSVRLTKKISQKKMRR